MFTISLYLVIGWLFTRLIVSLEKESISLLCGIFFTAFWPIILFFALFCSESPIAKLNLWNRISWLIFGNPKK